MVPNPNGSDPEPFSPPSPGGPPVRGGEGRKEMKRRTAS